MARKETNKLQRRIVTHFDPKSPISEQYRTIRTNIQYASIEDDIKAIAVTSAGPSEGKSTTIANLAVVNAQQGKKVLLIDTDLRKPTIHHTFRVANVIGLTNVLTKQSYLEEATTTTDIPNLDVLTSGPIPPNPAELLGTKAMEELLEEAKEQYDIILFDTPPVLAVTDAQIVANKCDGVILVVSSGKTNRDGAVKAKELLVNANAKLLGAVLNQKKQKQSEYYYYYGNK